MTPIQINPYVFAAFVTIIVGSMGFFIGNFFSSSSEAQRKLSDTVTRLNNTVIKLETTISGMEKLNANSKDACYERHEKIAKDIEKLENKVFR